MPMYEAFAATGVFWFSMFLRFLWCYMFDWFFIWFLHNGFIRFFIRGFCKRFIIIQVI